MFQLRILRQLVDWQLTHSFVIRDIIDTAWGTKKKAHKKEALAPRPPPPPEDPYSKERLAFQATGQDQTRTRFWIADSERALIHSLIYHANRLISQTLLECGRLPTHGKSRQSSTAFPRRGQTILLLLTLCETPLHRRSNSPVRLRFRERDHIVTSHIGN